jgi:hypothetical protein
LDWAAFLSSCEASVVIASEGGLDLGWTSRLLVELGAAEILTARPRGSGQAAA